MLRKNLGLFITLGVVLILFGMGCSGYNGIITQDENVNNTWGDVQNAYQFRANLIPNLVEVVKKEANFEKTTLESITNARASVSQIKVDSKDLTPEKLQQIQANQGQLSQSIGRLMVVSENYPNLQSNESFRGLQKQLEGAESRIKLAMDNFNASVANYNKKVRSFPMNLLANSFGFKSKPSFVADAGASKVPVVNMDK
jgi:LemA protein